MVKKSTKKDAFTEDSLVESMRNDDAIRLLDSLGLGKEPSEAPKKDAFILKVMVIEDDESARDLYQTYLTSKRCMTVPCENGHEAITAVTEHPDTDVVLLDIKIPPPDGVALLTTFRKQNFLKDATIIVISGHLTPDTVKACVEMKVHKILTKPVDLDGVFELIKATTDYEKIGKDKKLL
ncbi:MAG: response regulator [Oligoflexales bacterium]